MRSRIWRDTCVGMFLAGIFSFRHETRHCLPDGNLLPLRVIFQISWRSKITRFTHNLIVAALTELSLALGTHMSYCLNS